jgi:hypothetical protein
MAGREGNSTDLLPLSTCCSTEATNHRILEHPWFKCKEPQDHKDKGDPHGDDIKQAHSEDFTLVSEDIAAITAAVAVVFVA